MSRLDAVTDLVEKAKLARYHAKALARLCLVSPSELRRYFKQVFGRPPQEWLDELRLMHAARLLVSGVSIKEVVFQLHFTHESQFYHRFKDHNGCTPREFLHRYFDDEKKRTDRLRLAPGTNLSLALSQSSFLDIEEMNHCQKIGVARFGRHSTNARPTQ